MSHRHVIHRDEYESQTETVYGQLLQEEAVAAQIRRNLIYQRVRIIFLTIRSQVPFNHGDFAKAN